MQVRPLLLTPNESDHVELIPVSCLHIGAANFNERRALRTREFILESTDRYVWDLGDTTENAIRGSIGNGVYAQVLSPSQQQRYAEDFWRPVRERGRLLGIHDANHPFRTTKEVDYNPAEDLAYHLQVPYLGWQNVFSVKVGDNHKRRYNIFSWHGTCNARTLGAIINALAGLRNLVQGCDAYVMGHVHRRARIDQVSRVPGKNQLIEGFEHYVSVGGYIDYSDSYAEMKGLVPAVPGTVVIKLYRDWTRIEVVDLDV